MRHATLVLFTTVACVTSAQTVRLQLKFPKGKVDRMTVTTTTTSSMTGAGVPPQGDSTSKQTMSMLTSVVGPTSRGTEVNLTYESIHTSVVVGGKVVPNADSGVGSALKGKTINLFFDPSGDLAQVTGYDKLMDQSFAKMPPQFKASMKQMLNEKAFKQMWAMSFGGVFPIKPIRVGERWSSAMNLPQGPINLNMKMQMKLVGIENHRGHKMARIALTGTGTLDATKLTSQGMAFKTDAIRMGGTCYFDIDRGWMSDQSMFMTMHATEKVQSRTIGVSMRMNLDSKVTSLK
jgi:hypothetical protein